MNGTANGPTNVRVSTRASGSRVIDQKNASAIAAISVPRTRLACRPPGATQGRPCHCHTISAKTVPLA